MGPAFLDSDRAIALRRATSEVWQAWLPMRALLLPRWPQAVEEIKQGVLQTQASGEELKKDATVRDVMIASAYLSEAIESWLVDPERFE